MKKLLFIFAGLACAMPSRAVLPRERDEHLLTIQGQGKVTAVPDVAVLTVEVSQDGPELDPVLTRVRQDMNRVLEVVKKQEIAEKDIRTELFQVTPKFEQDKRGNPQRIGYSVTNRVNVKIRDLKKTGKVLTTVLGSGATTVQGPQFEIDNPLDVEKRALTAAVQDAKVKAQTVADAAGIHLGPITAINPQQVVWPMASRQRSFAKAMVAEGAQAEEPIAAGEQTLNAYVTISYSIP